jgi:hypothetical protein
MDIDESYYTLIAAVLTCNATMQQQAELELLLVKDDAIRKIYQQLSFIYQHPLPGNKNDFDADVAFQQFSQKQNQ